MPVSMIEATVEEAELKTDRKAIKVFKPVRFRLPDGSEQVLPKVVTTTEVGDAIVPGATGRFYLYKVFDLKGVHGVRTTDGRAVYGFPGFNLKLYKLIVIVNILWIGVTMVGRGGVPLLGVAMLIFGCVGWYFTLKCQHEAQAQFEADGP